MNSWARLVGVTALLFLTPTSVLLTAVAEWTFPVVCAAAVGSETRATKSPESPTLRSADLTITLDPQTGGLQEIRYADEVLGRQAQRVPPLDLKQNDQWLIGHGGVSLNLVGVERLNAKTVVATAQAGDWRIAVRYELDATWPMLTRVATLTWQGKEPTKLKGFWLGSPTFVAGKTAYYYAPGNYPPQRFAAEGFHAGASHSFSRSLSPLIAQLGPRRSIVWISDELTDASDHTSVSVTETDAGLRVNQSFQVMARMRPGDSQTIGSACWWLLPCDGEAALLRIHDWMRRRGHVPPADRPDWFRDAVFYSFHPGGTIGSNFHDLGGFQPAQRLLPHIAELGCNAIWIMPIEDAGVYHPRDYYQFQPGLGTADEYRDLVARAHQLGLHVLQDCVPHGGRNDYPRAKAHPEWLAYEEDGSTLSYWCFDFNWPAWRQYMAGVARHYVTKFDVDGYRVDAVGGSKIPNWNPKIPYGRASFAQLQGGLNMLRSLRSAVKESKPREGGLLAEVQGSVYGTASDAVYDFTGCYQAFQDLRKLPADEFVPRLRRWLHEQQYSETPDLIRLRHVESHDSLRAELWYGVQPMRAMMALSAWIHGMPLVYHESENGHEAAFRRIFAIRRQLSELSRGAVDYLGVETPSTVFSCLRTHEARASVVLINLASEPIEATASVPVSLLPEPLRKVTALTLLRPDRDETLQASLRQGRLSLPVKLAPFEYTVCALRQAPLGSTGASPLCLAGPQPATAPADSYEPVIDPQTGLLDGLQSAGKPLLGGLDLYLPAACQQAFKKVSCAPSSTDPVYRLALDRSTLELCYKRQADGLHIQSRWLGDIPAHAALYLPVIGVKSWSVATAEGTLASDYLARHLACNGATGNIYWRAQGTNVLWDSLIHPLGTQFAQALTVTGSRTFHIGFIGETMPARVQWLDHLGSRQQLGALISWNDPQVPSSPICRELEIVVGAPAPDPKAVLPVGLRPDAGGWIFENAHYRLRLSRSGIISQLWTKTPALRTIIDRGDLYTDHGFSDDHNRFGASNEVEAASRIWRDEQNFLRVRFEGRLRGFQRFELLQPPIEYLADYTLGPTASFRATYGVRPHADAAGKMAFLALMSPLPDVRQAIFKVQGRLLHAGTTGDGRSRGWQSQNQQPAGMPDEIELRSDQDSLLHLTGLTCGGAALGNTFAHGHNFFLAWFDGPPKTSAARQWRTASAVWTVGRAAPELIGQAPSPTVVADSQVLLDDPGFEQAMGLQPVSLRTGQPLPQFAAQSAWLSPAGGHVVSAPVHTGQAAAEVVNPSGAYALWRQPVAITSLRPGAKLRLAAWIKGDGIRQGDANWKVGTVRFAVRTEKTMYVSSVPLLGTFDWKQATVELVVPAGLRSLSVEAGLNGATGTIWIDDVELTAQ